MAHKDLLSPVTLRQLLRYEPDTGKLFWRKRGAQWFDCTGHTADRKATAWNNRFAGKQAFTALHRKGYLHGCVLSMAYLAHRVIWAMVHDEWPEIIDHINGDPADNRLENLRAVQGQDNQRNMKRAKTNTSGCTGVVWDKERGKWAAQIHVNQKNVHLGRFDGFDQAVEARKNAEVKYGFHANHGR